MNSNNNGSNKHSNSTNNDHHNNNNAGGRPRCFLRCARRGVRASCSSPGGRRVLDRI